MSGLPLMRKAAAAACKTNEIGEITECSGGKQHLGIKSLGCSLTLFLLPNLSLSLCFSDAFTFDGLQSLLG